MGSSMAKLNGSALADVAFRHMQSRLTSMEGEKVTSNDVEELEVCVKIIRLTFDRKKRITMDVIYDTE